MTPRNNQVLLLIGGNQGQRKKLLTEARNRIVQAIGPIAEASHVYETEPWGFDAEQHFLNQALLVKTRLSPLEVLDSALAIEAELGRVRKGTGYASRPMDIDLIYYNDEVIDTPRLTLPHPRLHLRRFVLAPMADICPQWEHPILHRSVVDLLVSCPDPCQVVQKN